MFTGIIEELGRVNALHRTDSLARIEIQAPGIASSVRVGDSIALNGVCLTAVRVVPPVLAFEAIPETLRRSNLGDLLPGSDVNLERPLAADGRLSGHFVQGHVDGMGRIRSVTAEGDSLRFWIDSPSELRRYMVGKGSIAVDGISLTISGCDSVGFEVAVIPHTRDMTTLGRKASGDTVNLEVDILAKHIERLMEDRVGT